MHPQGSNRPAAPAPRRLLKRSMGDNARTSEAGSQHSACCLGCLKVVSKSVEVSLSDKEAQATGSSPKTLVGKIVSQEPR